MANITIRRFNSSKTIKVPDTLIGRAADLGRIFELLAPNDKVKVIGLSDLASNKEVALSLVGSILRRGAGFESIIEVVKVAPGEEVENGLVVVRAAAESLSILLNQLIDDIEAG